MGTANPKKEPLKFEGEYDFDKANEEFKEVLEKLQKSSIESKPENGESDKSATELEEGEVEPATHDESSSPVPENFYDKKKSFFDTISCEATEKSKSGSRPRQDRNAEFKLNKETFGVAGNRGGRGGYYNRRGYNNYNNGGGYRGNQGQGGQYGGYNGFNGRFARDGNNFRGGRGRGGYEQRGQRAGGEGGRGNWRNQEN